MSIRFSWINNSPGRALTARLSGRFDIWSNRKSTCEHPAYPKWDGTGKRRTIMRLNGLS